MANPYVSVPGGPRWAQAAWLNAYLRQQAQPRYGVGGALAEGFAQGLNQAPALLQKNWESQATLDQQMSLQQDRDASAQSLQQNSLEFQAQKQQEAARLLQVAKDREQARIGAQRALLYGTAAQPVTSQAPPNPYAHVQSPETYGPSPVSDITPPQGDYASAPTPQPDYGSGPDLTSDYSGGAEPPVVSQGQTPGAVSSRPFGLNDAYALVGANPTLFGSLPTTELDAFYKSLQTKQETRQHLLDMADNELRLGNVAGYRALAAEAGLQPDQMATGPTPEYNLKATELGAKTAGLAGQIPGVTANQAQGIEGGFIKPLDAATDPFKAFNEMGPDLKYRSIIAAPPGSPLEQAPLVQALGGIDTAKRIATAALNGDEQSKMRIAEAAAIGQDMSQRARDADQGKMQLAPIKGTLDILEPLIPTVLQSGVVGHLVGELKSKANALTQAYPDLQQLNSLSKGTIGPTVRQIGKERGNMSEGDVERAVDAFGVRDSDRVEVALVKVHALRAFVDAADQGWDIYRTTNYKTPTDEVNRRMESVRAQMRDAITSVERVTGYKPGQILQAR